MVNDNIVGLLDGTVRLVPHLAEWAGLFAAEKARLTDALAPYLHTVVRDIQHVGSTSIPGIPAKPIIDIAVVVTDFSQAWPCIEAIQGLGYAYLGENEVPGRHFFYLGEATTSGRTHHLHMFEQTSIEWRQTVGFRDYLRAHPMTAAAYGALKIDLAAQYADDRPAYLLGKAPFITQVLRLSVPDRPPLWTTIHDHATGLRFDTSQDVVDQPVTIEFGTGRIHLMTADRTLLYFEVRQYEDADLAETHQRLTADLRDRFDTLTVTDLEETVLAGLPALQFTFAWDDTRREAIYLRQGDRLARIIYDPRGPLNLAMLETVAWPPVSA